MVNELHIARQPRGGDSSPAPHLKAFNCFAVQLPFAFLHKKNIIGLQNLYKFCWLCLALWRSGQILEHYKMLLWEIIWLDINLYVNTKNKTYYNSLFSLSLFQWFIWRGGKLPQHQMYHLSHKCHVLLTAFPILLLWLQSWTGVQNNRHIVKSSDNKALSCRHGIKVLSCTIQPGFWGKRDVDNSPCNLLTYL